MIRLASPRLSPGACVRIFPAADGFWPFRRPHPAVVFFVERSPEERTHRLTIPGLAGGPGRAMWPSCSSSATKWLQVPVLVVVSWQPGLLFHVGEISYYFPSALPFWMHLVCLSNQGANSQPEFAKGRKDVRCFCKHCWCKWILLSVCQ